jgi:hypothetical protein
VGGEPKEMRPDILTTLLLIIAKLTIVHSMPWIVVAVPFFISFGIGFINGVIQGIKDRDK